MGNSLDSTIPICMTSHWTSRLQPARQDSACATVALMLLLVVWLVEPLTCSSYCRNLVLPRAHDAFAAQQQDIRVGTNNGMFVSDDLNRELAHFRPVVLPNLFVCFIDLAHSAPLDAPFAPSPLPIHEHLASLMLISLFVLVILLQHCPLIPPLAPSLCALRPLLRPPISSAT